MEKSVQNIQDVFLNNARKEKTVTTIYLMSGVKLTGPTSGTGSDRVTYSAAANTATTFDSQSTIQIRGLSGANPPGVHTIIVLRKP